MIVGEARAQFDNLFQANRAAFSPRKKASDGSSVGSRFEIVCVQKQRLRRIDKYSRQDSIWSVHGGEADGEVAIDEIAKVLSLFEIGGDSESRSTNSKRRSSSFFRFPIPR